MPLSLVAFADEAVGATAAQAATSRVQAGSRFRPAPWARSASSPRRAKTRSPASVFRAAYPSRAGAARARRPPCRPGRVARAEVVFRGSVRESAARLFPGPRERLGRSGARRIGARPHRSRAPGRSADLAGPLRGRGRGGARSRHPSRLGRDAPVGADPVDYTTFSVMRLLRRRQASSRSKTERSTSYVLHGGGHMTHARPDRTRRSTAAATPPLGYLKELIATSRLRRDRRAGSRRGRGALLVARSRSSATAPPQSR